MFDYAPFRAPDAPPAGPFVRIGQTGDGRRAVLEMRTGEPVQYVTNPRSEDKLLESWEEFFTYRARKAAQR